MAAQAVDVTVSAGVIGDQPFFAGDHRRFVDLRMFQQSRLDFAQFNTQTTDLHLVIIAPQVLESAVDQVAPDVTGAVHPAVGERVVEETLGGQLRPVQIAPRHLHAADEQLAHHAQRHRLQLAIEHIHACIGDGFADRRIVRRHRACAVPRRHIDSGFGRAIQVMQRTAWKLLFKPAHQAARQGFTAAHHAYQPGGLSHIAMGEEHIEH